eukprot:7483633-Ditylum_brightwellii.AAC.1
MGCSPAAPSPEVDDLRGERNNGAHRAVPAVQVRVRWHTCDPYCSPRRRACANPCHATARMRRIPCKQTMRTTSARTSVPRMGRHRDVAQAPPS